MVRHTSLMVVPAASMDPVYVRPVQEAPVEMDDLSVPHRGRPYGVLAESCGGHNQSKHKD